jgi:hypothetical protein
VKGHRRLHRIDTALDVAESGLAIGDIADAQPSDIDGDAKLLGALAMETIADAVVVDGRRSRRSRSTRGHDWRATLGLSQAHHELFR